MVSGPSNAQYDSDYNSALRRRLSSREYLITSVTKKPGVSLPIEIIWVSRISNIPAKFFVDADLLLLLYLLLCMPVSSLLPLFPLLRLLLLPLVPVGIWLCPIRVPFPPLIGSPRFSCLCLFEIVRAS